MDTAAEAVKLWMQRREKNGKTRTRRVGYESLGLSSDLCDSLQRHGYDDGATRFQRSVIPRILAGTDVVVEPEGSAGVTVAILAPMLEKLKQRKPQGGVRALIVCPSNVTRRIFRKANKLAGFTDLVFGLLDSTETAESQLETLALNPDAIIATPDSLLHHLSSESEAADKNNCSSLSLRAVEYVVFDDASELFDLGFGEQLNQILGHLSHPRQVSLFTASYTKAVRQFAKANLPCPRYVRPLNGIVDHLRKGLTSGLASLSLQQEDPSVQSKDTVKKRKAFQQPSSDPSEEQEQGRSDPSKYVKLNNSDRGIACEGGVQF